MMTMNANEIAKQALDFQKGAFAGWYGAMSILQDQAATAVDMMLDQTSWIPDQGRQLISSWVSTCKNERDRFKVYMEESFSGLEKYLAQDTKTAPARPTKPAAEAKTAAPVGKSKAAAVEEKKAPAAQETKQSIQ
jgi:DNA replication initiation complex subunit (GINS family)